MQVAEAVAQALKGKEAVLWLQVLALPRVHIHLCPR